MTKKRIFISTLAGAIVLFVSLAAMYINGIEIADPLSARTSAFRFTMLSIVFLAISYSASSLALVFIIKDDKSGSYPPMTWMLLYVTGFSSMQYITFAIGMSSRSGSDQAISKIYLASLYAVGSISIVLATLLLSFVYYPKYTKKLISIVVKFFQTKKNSVIIPAIAPFVFLIAQSSAQSIFFTVLLVIVLIGLGVWLASSILGKS